MTVLFGLVAAVLYGLSDFAGGFASRRENALTVLLTSYPTGAVLIAALLPVFPGHLDLRTALFGIAGGLAGVVGVVFLYSLMTVAPINVISPVTAVLAAVVPVLVGVGLGERPALLTWLGIVLGLGAVMLVSRTDDDNPHGRVTLRIIALACVSGLGFGLYFVFLDQAGSHSGIWPLLISRITAAVLTVPLALGRGSARLVHGRVLPIVILTGCCDALANLFFLLSARHGLLALASVLTSLYPATTVLLAVTVLRERLNTVQRTGLLLAAGAIVLVTV